MSDLIAKIGRFFAEQEAQIQQTYTQVARPPVQGPRPPNVVHKVPLPVASSPLQPERRPVQKPPRTNSFTRRRLPSPPTETLQPQTEQESKEDEALFDGDQHQKKLREISALLSSMTKSTPTLTDEGWKTQQSGGLDSWRSSASEESRVSSEDQPNCEETERQRKLRPPPQKLRKRKKKRAAKRSNQESEPDPKLLAKMNAEKVEAALALAQERARRFQQEQLQGAHERELERQETALRVQEQMMKIEAVRARSFRGSNSSLMTTVNSSLQSSEVESNNETESVWTANTEDLETIQPSEFMTELETQLRQKMSLEMRIKENYIEKHKQRERVRLKLDKVQQQNAIQRPKVSRLAATKAELEMELSAVLAEIVDIRQQRRDLENADSKERARRLREAERELQIRLREEEWIKMMEEEKARSEVAAEARAKANQRVAKRAANLRREMQSYRYQPREKNLSRNQSNNNESDSESQLKIDIDLSKSVPSFKMDLFLPPELADFEEDGLCGDRERCLQSLAGNQTSKLEPTSFCWQIPSFPDDTKFREAVIDMVSDDDD